VHDDLDGSRRIAGTLEYAVTAGVQAGTTGTLSVFPLAVVSDAETAWRLGSTWSVPRLYRLAHHPAAKWLLLAYDFARARHGTVPGAAQFRLVVYAAPARWLRAVPGKDDFPAQFEAVARAGIWMPFTDGSGLAGLRSDTMRATTTWPSTTPTAS
jgi:hypothetical protein